MSSRTPSVSNPMSITWRFPILFCGSNSLFILEGPLLAEGAFGFFSVSGPLWVASVTSNDLVISLTIWFNPKNISFNWWDFWSAKTFNPPFSNFCIPNLL